MRARRIVGLIPVLASISLAFAGRAGAGTTKIQSAGDAWVKVVEATKGAVVVISTEKAQGRGFIVEPNGTLVTNYHVIGDAREIAVKLPSGEVFRRTLVLATDESKDLTVLKIEGVDLPFVPLGNSNDCRLAQEVLLLGAPRGLEQSVSSGLISSVRLLESLGMRIIQTSAAASPGSSGGPLLNTKGEAIGVLAFSVVDGQNLNFAIPINYVRGMLDTVRTSDVKPSRVLDSTTSDASKSRTVSVEKRPGVWLAGYGSAGSFQTMFIDLLNFLGSQGVQVSNRPSEIGPMRSDSASLPYLLEAMPKVGATSLLYMVVEHGWSNIHRIKIQCYEASGKLLWQEDSTSATSWATTEEGAARAATEIIKAKLKPHVGKPGLPLRPSEPEKSSVRRGVQSKPLAYSSGAAANCSARRRANSPTSRRSRRCRGRTPGVSPARRSGRSGLPEPGYLLAARPRRLGVVPAAADEGPDRGHSPTAHRRGQLIDPHAHRSSPGLVPSLQHRDADVGSPVVQ